MRLEWREEALDDLDRIFEFNSERSEAMAMNMERRIADRAQGLRTSPYLGRPVEGIAVRRLSVTDIQYVIDYELAEDLVVIVRVRSAREIR